MAVTKQTYTAAATWTVSQLASIFESAFIGAGLMSAWHDSFLSGSIENRVIALDYGTGTYSVIYYWFQFTTTGVFIAQATGWNAGTHVPTGTQYLDYFSTTTSATSGHGQLLAVATTTTVTLTRYTTTNLTFFLLRSNAAYYTFGIDHASVSLQSWVDLNKGYHNGLYTLFCENPVGDPMAGTISIDSIYQLRRCFMTGAVNRGTSSINNHYFKGIPRAQYAFQGALSGELNNQVVQKAVALPYGNASANPAFGSDFDPVYTGLNYCSAVASNLPSDFGITGSRSSNTNTIQSTLVVSAGVEEYEVISFSNGSNTTGAASPLFLARIV